jgi:DNA-binding transcriptional regulator LsrR (DeoR family)
MSVDRRSPQRMPAREAATGDGPDPSPGSAPALLTSVMPGVGDGTVSAAWLYYHEGMTQAEIAEVLKVSRPSVANMLARARATGVVRISVRPDYLDAFRVSRELRQRFGLQQALIVPTTPHADTVSVHRALGKAAALYLEGTVRAGETIVTAWGATMLEAALALTGMRVPDLTIAQALGGLSTADDFNPTKVATLMADKLGARVYHLFVPCVVESLQVREILVRDRSIHSAFEVARSAHRAMIGIGKVAADATVVRAGFMTELQIHELRAKGAVGDLMGRFFDIHGNPVQTELNDRIMALDLEDLRRIKPVIAVAGGSDKVQAILGAIRGGYVDVLIIDDRTATAVLEFDRTNSPA